MSEPFDQFLPAITEFARRIFNAGILHERRRLLNEINVKQADTHHTYHKGITSDVRSIFAEAGDNPIAIPYIISRLDCSQTSIRSAVKALAAAGEIERVYRGVYRISSPAPK